MLAVVVMRLEKLAGGFVGFGYVAISGHALKVKEASDPSSLDAEVDPVASGLRRRVVLDPSSCHFRLRWRFPRNGNGWPSAP